MHRDLISGAKLLFWTAMVLLLGTLVGYGAAGGLHSTAAESSATHSAVPGQESPFVRVAEALLPAVVSVEARRWIQHPALGPQDPEGLGEEDEDSLGPEDGEGDEGEGFFPFGPGEEIPVPSSGSGFIVDAEGYVYTNHHVVRGASKIWVHLADGRQLRARVVGGDPQTDVAVLKVESETELPTVPLGNSDAVKIGDWVAAIGNPLGVLNGSMTVGVVSAKGRNEIAISGGTPSYQDFIQTDASINFGNSGGPLVNSRGEAVGINTAFNGPGRGIGFAISINMAKEVAQSLISEGRVVRGYLGVVLQPLDADLAAGLGLPTSRGALVREVEAETPAARVGIEPGDVILEFDRAEVRDVQGLRLLVARTPIGRRVPVRVFRYGGTRDVEVSLDERPTQLDQSAEAEPVTHEDPTELGLEVSSLPANAEVGGAPAESGVVVDSVALGGIAAEVGLQIGDLILEVNGRPIREPNRFDQAVREGFQNRRPIVLRVQRGNLHWFLALPFRDRSRP